jgi:hypothetical protein
VLFVNHLEKSLNRVNINTPNKVHVDMYNDEVFSAMEISVEHIGEPVDIILVKIS